MLVFRIKQPKALLIFIEELVSNTKKSLFNNIPLLEDRLTFHITIETELMFTLYYLP